MISLKRLLGFGMTASIAGLAVASITAVAFTGDGSEASSHREAPAIGADPLADTTDVYAFIAPDAPDKLTLVGNWIPLEEPAGGPNFYNFGDDVSYEFSIDNNGDAKPDVTYEYRFRTAVVDPTTFLYATGPIDSLTDPNFNIRQTYDVYRNGVKINPTPLASPPNNIGPTSTPNYDALAAQAVYTLPDGSKHFAGQRDDPFFVDLGAIFDLATIRMLPGDMGGGIDGVGGFNTHSIVLQVPLTSLTSCHCDPAPTGSAAILGVWSDTYRSKVQVLKKDGASKDNGKLVQVSRLGNPLVNEVVIPLSSKDAFNASDPKDDAQFLPFVLNSDLASKLNAVYSLGLPTTNRQDLVTVFLTGIPGLNQPANVRASEQLRINVGIKPASAGCASYSTLGVIAGDNCGFPNGRRLADDVTDVELRAVACGYGFDIGPCDSEAAYAATTERLGDGVDGNDKAFLSAFPYVASPHSGFVHSHHTGSVVVPVMAGLGGAAAMLLALVGGGLVLGVIRRRREADEIARSSGSIQHERAGGTPPALFVVPAVIRCRHDGEQLKKRRPPPLPHESTGGHAQSLALRADVMRFKIAAFVLALSALAGFFAVRASIDGRGSQEQSSPTASRRSTAASQVRTLEQTVRDRPADARALTQLASAYVQLSRETGDPAFYALADTAIARARSVDGADVNALVVAGTVALAKHDFEHALALGEQARMLNPDVVATYGVITDALVELGRYDEAAVAAQEMVDRRPDFASLARVSYVRELYGDIDGAIEAMQQAADAGAGLGFDEAWAYVIIGNLHLQQGDVAAAESAYVRAERALPGDAMVDAALARIAVARGDRPRAEALLREAVEQRPLPEYAIALGDLLASEGRAAAAEEQYALVRATQQLFAASGVDTDIELALFDADRGIEPEGTYERALAAYGRRPTIFAADTVAWAAFKAGRIDEAQHYMNEALRLATRDPRLAYHAGIIAQTAGDPVAAETHLREAIAAEHTLPLAYAASARDALESLTTEAAR